MRAERVDSIDASFDANGKAQYFRKCLMCGEEIGPFNSIHTASTTRTCPECDKKLVMKKETKGFDTLADR